ncbi:MAG: thymidine phosphorylase, partial [Kiritimatiellaeota bacterium]|nr:thymidine phosphorylase [Kiritimatiellota bacterium]
GPGLGLRGAPPEKPAAIPGSAPRLSVNRFRDVLETVGCSIIGQTDRLAPVDKKLYALRDVTGTVPSIPLIAASIMSKKLAEGADALVLDVKVGEGAFMKTRPEAQRLADTMVAIGKNMGRNVAALLTPMDEPLGRAVGNALEIIESIDILKNQGPADVRDLTLTLGEKMLTLSGAYPDAATARNALENALASGTALATFRAMVAAHGGDTAVIDDPQRLLETQCTGMRTCALHDIPAPHGGTVTRVSADAIGRVVLLLGGGRRKTDDAIHYGVGVSRLVKAGETIEAGQPLMRLHAPAPLDNASPVVRLATAAVTL